MTNYQVLSKILGSKYFEQLMVDDRAIDDTLKAYDLKVDFEPNIKYFQIKNVNYRLLIPDYLYSDKVPYTLIH